MSSTTATDAFTDEVARIRKKPSFQEPLVWGLITGEFKDGKLVRLVGVPRVNRAEHIGSYTMLWNQLFIAPDQSVAVVLVEPGEYATAAVALEGVVQELADQPHLNYHAFMELANGDTPDPNGEQTHLFVVFRHDFVSMAFLGMLEALENPSEVTFLGFHDRRD